MKTYKTIFSRYEKKYVITPRQYHLLMLMIGDRLREDDYGKSTVCNIYFDTPDFRLIRQSLEKPVFKEKLRLRVYNIPRADSAAFVEIKRKYKGIVYKRRVSLRYDEAVDWLCRGRPPALQGQIPREIEYCRSCYGALQPKVSLFYDREAYVGREDETLRLTFDSNIRFRTHRLDLSLGDGGCRRIDGGRIVMEIKCDIVFPLWLSEALSTLAIFPATFSKYGIAYQTMLQPQDAAATAHL
ncbi:MAG: polyphosphate polymerase domain-containing protein [Clostridia bacterium]|nr:polyphosphate polymerase domain-containing protein [Clostridia bacterium]